MLNNLQIEFKVRQQATKFAKMINKNKTMSQFFDSKAERCVWLKFKDATSRERVKNVILSQSKDIKVMHRESGIDYLYAE